jgi:predicted amino acid dehydrogenase
MVARIRSVLTPFKLGQETIRSVLGNAIELTVVAVPFTAAQAQAALRGHDRDWVVDQVHAAVALAAQGGASIVGCGGYTSIVSDNCQALQTEGFGVTSGNSLTAAAAVEALFGAADRAGVGRRVLGVVGATGNIGAMLAELAADQVERVILVGRPGAASRLKRVAARLPCATELATDLSALRQCSLVVSASNAPDPILLPEHFGDAPVVVCDAAVPADVSPRVAREKPNLVLLRGGLLRLPLGQQLALEGVSVTPGTVYACLAESAVLGLSRMRGSFSYGVLDIDRVRLIRTLARHHGFEVEANPYGGGGSWRGTDD